MSRMAAIAQRAQHIALLVLEGIAEQQPIHRAETAFQKSNNAICCFSLPRMPKLVDSRASASIPRDH